LKKYGEEIRQSHLENIELLVEDGQLIGVVKDDKGSPGAEIVYNTELHKGDARE